jgi:phospholipid/cholesterol/gamma-HCH transport system substrate-binding protein
VNKQALTPGRVAVLAAFTLSCFGLLTFLWLAFGGTTPLKPQGYRVTVAFDEATQLAKEADVRISGVPVGKVKTMRANPATGLTDAVLELDADYAPLPRDTRAILRAKTLLGETYVALTPGSRAAAKVAEGGRLGTGQVAKTVELDEVLRTLDPATRKAFRSWTQTLAVGLDGRGRDLNDALGQLAPFTEDTAALLAALRSQSTALSRVVADTGTVAAALTERRGQLRRLVESGDRAFTAIGSRDRSLAAAVRELPRFQREARTAVTRLTATARSADPLVAQLRPAARELSPTLVDLSAAAPDLEALLADLDPLVSASQRGLPAVRAVLGDLKPFLGALDAPVDELAPMVSHLDRFKPEIGAFFANTTAATQAASIPAGGTEPVHYLRTTAPLGPEALAAWPQRLRTNRNNAYPEPGAFSALAQGMKTLDARACGPGGVPVLDPLAAALPIAGDVLKFALADRRGAAPACRAQGGGAPVVAARPGR